MRFLTSNIESRIGATNAPRLAKPASRSTPGGRFCPLAAAVLASRAPVRSDAVAETRRANDPWRVRQRACAEHRTKEVRRPSPRDEPRPADRSAQGSGNRRVLFEDGRAPAALAGYRPHRRAGGCWRWKQVDSCMKCGRARGLVASGRWRAPVPFAPIVRPRLVHRRHTESIGCEAAVRKAPIAALSEREPGDEEHADKEPEHSCRYSR